MFGIFNKENYFKKNEKEFLEYLHRKNGTKLTKENLVFSFFDLEGNSYYKFPKDIALPMDRLGKLTDYMTWLSSGLTGKQLDDMIDFGEKTMLGVLKDGKGLAKIGWIFSELKERKNMVVSSELFYNIIALQIIRQDESPTNFNNDIQLQKVEAFKKLNEKNDTFFLNIQEFLKALNWSNITREELINILNDSTLRVAASLKMMEGLFGQLSPDQMQTLSKI